MNYATLARLIENLIRIGTIATINADQATCTVNLGDIVTSDLPFLTSRAGQNATFSLPEVGEQCIVLATGGELTTAVVLVGIYSNANPAPSTNPNQHLFKCSDGASLSYDTSTHILNFALPSGGKVSITSPDGTDITGNLNVNGKITASNGVETPADVIASGISLTSHTHSNVKTGPDQSGGPQ